MGKAKIRSKKAEHNGITFDSTMERDYYLHLLEQDDIQDIEIQPEYTLIEPFQIKCGRCIDGRVLSDKTGNSLKCRTCKGAGWRTRRAMKYTADFKITYEDGRKETVDVKGFANERFNYIRKIYELKFAEELIVIKKKKGEWVRS